MNNVSLIGRATKDPTIRNAGEYNIGKFTLAVDRGGKDKGADFITITTFGKTTDMVERFVRKGKMVGVSGKITTGKYDKDGATVYTTEVTANRIHIIEWPDKDDAPEGFTQTENDGAFAALDDDEIPF